MVVDPVRVSGEDRDWLVVRFEALPTHPQTPTERMAALWDVPEQDSDLWACGKVDSDGPTPRLSALDPVAWRDMKGPNAKAIPGYWQLLGALLHRHFGARAFSIREAAAVMRRGLSQASQTLHQMCDGHYRSRTRVNCSAPWRLTREYIKERSASGRVTTRLTLRIARDG